MPDQFAEAIATLRVISLGDVTAERAKRMARWALQGTNGDTLAGDNPGLAEVRYRNTNDRDLSAMTHALAALAEAIHLKSPCTCGCVDNETGIAVDCEGCRVIAGIERGIEEAREFLEPLTEEEK